MDSFQTYIVFFVSCSGAEESGLDDRLRGTLCVFGNDSIPKYNTRARRRRTFAVEHKQSYQCKTGFSLYWPECFT